MQIFTALVKDGVIVPDEGIELAEGSLVTVIAGESEGPFELTAEEEEELAKSIAEVERGNVISAAEVLRRLHR
jgi:hypothetical protein